MLLDRTLSTLPHAEKLITTDQAALSQRAQLAESTVEAVVRLYKVHFSSTSDVSQYSNTVTMGLIGQKFNPA